MAVWATSCLLFLATVGTVDALLATNERAETLDRLATIEATLDSVLRKNAEQEKIVESLLRKNADLEKRVEVLEAENVQLKEVVAVLNGAGKQKQESRLVDVKGIKYNEGGKDEKANVDDINKGDGQGQGIVDEQKRSDVDTSLTENRVHRQANVLNIVPSGTSAVAFTASLSTNTVNGLGQAQPIIYDNVITNVGNAYHSHLGVFIAPVSGVYVFSFDTMIEAGTREYLDLVRDGIPVIYGYTIASGDTHYETTSRTGVIQVNQGSEVWIRTSDSPGHGSGAIHGNQYSSFSGWLLAVIH